MSRAPDRTSAAAVGLTVGLLASRRLDRLRSAVRLWRVARSPDGQRAVAALAAVGIEQPSAPVVRFAVGVIRACDSERGERRYDPHDDDAREAFQRGALSRVRTPQGLPGLYLLLTIPALLDLQTAGNVVEQADDVLKDLAEAIVDGAMAPDQAGTIL